MNLQDKQKKIMQLNNIYTNVQNKRKKMKFIFLCQANATYFLLLLQIIIVIET